MRLTPAFLSLAAGLFSQAVRADPLPSDALPSDTTWVIHADADAARAAAPLWNLARQRFLEPRQADLAPRLELFARVTGMKPETDLKDITLYGNAYDETTVCIRVHGTMDREELVAYLKLDPEFRETPHSKHSILSWRDKAHDRMLYATLEPDLVFLSPSARTIEAALDTLDKKSPGLPAGSSLMPAHGKPILWLAGKDLAALPRAQKIESPLITQLDAASLGVRWSDDNLAIDTHVLARSEKTAQQIKEVAQGVKALIFLAASDDHAPPATKLLASVFNHLDITVDARDVTGDWTVGLDKIESVLDLAAHDDPTVPAGKVPAIPAVPDAKH